MDGISKKNKSHDCDKARLEAERLCCEDDSARDTDLSNSALFEDCRFCLDWAHKHVIIGKAALDLPQFDVSESLTQLILKQVEQEKAQTKVKTNSGFTQFAALAFGLSLFLMVEPYESFWGLGSWIIGLAILAAFKGLMGGIEGKSEERLTA